MNQEQETLERLLLTQAMVADIERYCLLDNSVEVCGLIGGHGEFAKSFYPTRNVAEDTRHGYLIAPEDQIQALTQMRQRREELLGIFHSHPNSEAEPSPTDLALAAYPGVAYLIASVADGEAKFSSYLFTGHQFDKLPMVVI